MAQVHPFRAFRYNPARVALDRVLTQPYDKISPAMQEKYYAADRHNLIAIEKGRVFPNDSAQNNVYTRAAAALEDWIRDNIVVQDPALSFYGYTQEYTVPGSEERRIRRGLIGAGKLEDYSAGIVFRHEQTLSGPKADRLELLRHIRTHTGQLFMLYSDAERRVDAILAEAESIAAPATELRDEYGVVHRLWVIADAERVAAIAQAMAEQKLVIADGHHRYETALNYRNEQPSRPRGSQRGLRIRDDDFHQYAQRRADDFADAPRGGQPARFFLAQCAASPRAVVHRGSVFVTQRRRAKRSARQILTSPHRNARAALHRGVSGNARCKARLLRAW